MHYAFYMNVIKIIWYGNEDEDKDEGETDCHMDRDKGCYTVMFYDTTKCIHTYVHTIHTCIRT